MRLLRRLGPGHHRRKADELAVMFRLVLGPDLLHRRDLLAHLLRADLVNRAVVFRLFGIPKKTGSHETCMGLFLSSGCYWVFLPVLCSEVCPGKASMFSRRQSC